MTHPTPEALAAWRQWADSNLTPDMIGTGGTAQAIRSVALWAYLDAWREAQQESPVRYGRREGDGIVWPQIEGAA